MRIKSTTICHQQLLVGTEWHHPNAISLRERAEKWLRRPFRHHAMHLLVCLFLDGILYNKVIVGSVAREWALYIVLLSSEPEGGIGTPECVASYSVGDRMSLELAVGV